MKKQLDEHKIRLLIGQEAKWIDAKGCLWFGILTYEDLHDYPENVKTPIMRKVSSMTEEEKRSLHDEFNHIGCVILYDETLIESFNLITWLLDRGIWFEDEDFDSGLIKEKQ